MKLLWLLLLMPVAHAVELEEVKVKSVEERLRELGRLKDSIIHTETVTEKEISHRQAGTLADAIEDQTGVESREGCSICGMRRVRINGMKGEHTTVLNDGVPLNSTVSSFYGFDAIAAGGIDRIEISRGAGASLIAPEAMGGVINIIRKKPTKNRSSVDLSMGNIDYQKFSATVERVSDDRKYGTLLTAQYLNRGQFDADDNGVNESPKLDSHFIALKHAVNLSSSESLTFDLVSLSANTFGGPMENSTFLPTVAGSGNITFVNNDVRNQYTGDPLEVNETIHTKRKEITANYIKQIDDISNYTLTGSYAVQTQDSFYEGSDYYNTNQTVFTDAQYNRQVNANHFVTIGLDNKVETLKSQSYQFFTVLGRPRDNYDYLATGIYLRDIWTPTEKIELASAIRLNQITTDWTDQTTKDDEIDEFLAAPRVHLKYTHNKEFVSRLGLGLGYRAPLTFFESEHGILDDGFDVNITDLEKSKSATYSLSYDTQRTTAALSGSITRVENLAYVDTNPAVPVLKNDPRELEVKNVDFTIGRQLTKELSIGFVVEKFMYDDAYKQNMVIAAIEDRIKLDLEYESDKLLITGLVTWVGSRDLAEYGYSGRFNRWDGANATVAKSTTAEAFFTIDTKISYKLSSYSVYFGVNNLLDYTQDQSPLFFDGAGEFDVTHIWGPLRGRQIYAGVTSEF